MSFVSKPQSRPITRVSLIIEPQSGLAKKEP